MMLTVCVSTATCETAHFDKPLTRYLGAVNLNPSNAMRERRDSFLNRERGHDESISIEPRARIAAFVGTWRLHGDADRRDGVRGEGGRGAQSERRDRDAHHRERLGRRLLRKCHTEQREHGRRHELAGHRGDGRLHALQSLERHRYGERNRPHRERSDVQRRDCPGRLGLLWILRHRNGSTHADLGEDHRRRRRR
jgi:hypothetical protein